MALLLEGKKALILGIANERSIAWGVAQAFKEQGASIALTYVNDAIKKRLDPLADQLNADFVEKMDVALDEDYANLSAKIASEWGGVDIIVHSLAFAQANDLKNPFVQTSRAGFLEACNISAFSLVGLCNALKEQFNPNASVMAMTYHGSQKVIENYNVMGVAKAALEASMRYLAYDLGATGVRVNCISAGPIKTLAASGVSGFRGILKQVEDKAPLKRNVTPADIGGVAVYLASDLSRGVTGQVEYCDSGFSILGP